MVGAGPTGLAAALALSKQGIEVALAAEQALKPSAGEHDDADPRTAALFPPSIRVLEAVGAWQPARPHSAPLEAIRIVDDTGRMLRAPEVLFKAAEIGWSSFGFNVPHRALNDALIGAALACAGSQRIEVLTRGKVAALVPGEDGATLGFSDGSKLCARLVVAADGRGSLCRPAAEIETQTWTYQQTAIASRFQHTMPHHGISTELHRPSGPCTTVPLPGRASSLVWVERPAEAERLMALEPDAFLAALETRQEGLLGSLSSLGHRRAFPLSGLVAEPMAKNRVALVGEAGHVIPPIGAQGLNLGLADIAVLADCVREGKLSGGDIGAPAVLAAYAAARRPQVSRRSQAVDLVNRMLISDVLPVSLARGFGLHAIAAFPPLKRRLIREGLVAADPLPSMMQ